VTLRCLRVTSSYRIALYVPLPNQESEIITAISVRQTAATCNRFI